MRSHGCWAGAAALTGSSSALAEESSAISDEAILNFVLNLEYLEAEFYLHATTGVGLNPLATTGLGDRGRVTGGRRVPLVTKAVRQYAVEISADEKDHVLFLRARCWARPRWRGRPSTWSTASPPQPWPPGSSARGETFDGFESEANFLLAAFIFEDVGVTAYKGGAPLIANKSYLEAAAGFWRWRRTTPPTSAP